MAGANLSNYDQIFYAGNPYTMVGMCLVGHTAVLLRLGPRNILPLHLSSWVQNNKYILWTLMYFLAQYAKRLVSSMNDQDSSIEHKTSQTSLCDNDRSLEFFMAKAYVLVSLFAMVAVGLYKHSSQKSAAKQVKNF